MTVTAALVSIHESFLETHPVLACVSQFRNRGRQEHWFALESVRKDFRIVKWNLPSGPPVAAFCIASLVVPPKSDSRRPNVRTPLCHRRTYTLLTAQQPGSDPLVS